jgi:hypothetical protein
MRRTGGQYLSARSDSIGKAATDRGYGWSQSSAVTIAAV